MYWNSNSKIYDGMAKADILVRNKTNITIVINCIFLKILMLNIQNLKPLSHCHEFAHDMRQVSASYNSPHIATNVH